MWATSEVLRFAAVAAVGLLSAVPLRDDPASAPPARRLSLHYDPDLARGDFASPAVRVRLGTHRAWLLVDTGAGVHTLASWFVKAAGLESSDAVGGRRVEGRDSVGRSLAFRWVDNVSARLEGGEVLAFGPAAVVEFPPEFEQYRVGGVLSPQLLAVSGEAAALDLRVPELRVEPFAEAMSRMKATRLRAGRDGAVCRPPDAPLPTMHYAMRLRVGARDAWLTLDSGANHTTLRPESRAARALPGPFEDAGHSTGLAGDPIPVKVARRVPVRLGGFVTPVDVRLGATATECGVDGRLGIDAMQACAFVLGERETGVACSKE